MPRRIVSDSELALLRGYQAEPQGRGYYFESPTGRCCIMGAMPGDECHDQERWGMINISKCEDAIVREKGRPQLIPIDAGLKQNFAAYEFDQSWVDKMTIERRDEPVIFVVGADGAHLIDGTHRTPPPHAGWLHRSTGISYGSDGAEGDAREADAPAERRQLETRRWNQRRKS